MQYGMVIDMNRCVGCHACAIACKAEWEVPADQGRNWVRRLGPAQTPNGLAYTYYVGLCNHCDSPTCVPVCPVRPVEKTFKDAKSGKTKTMMVAATWKDPFDGTVQVDKDRCIGCGACARACPYGARYVHAWPGADGGVDRKVDKCTYCVPRLEQGLEPACVQTCLAKARIFGDLTDPTSEVAQYVKKGAVGLTSAAVQIGPNSRYYGNKKDMALLMPQAPATMPQVSQRRMVLSQMMEPFKREFESLGLAGMLATAEDDDRKG